MLQTKVLACFDTQNSCEKGISIITGTSTIHQVSLDDWVAWISVPALPKGLLIHMTVHQHTEIRRRAIRASLSSNINNQERTPSLLLNWLDLRPLKADTFRKLAQMIHLLEQVTILLPFYIEKWSK